MHLNKLMKKTIGIFLWISLLIPFKVNATTAVITEYSPKLQEKLSKYTVIQHDGNVNAMVAYKKFPDYVVGLTDYNKHEIVVKVYKDPMRNQHLLDHEVGHVFDTWDIKYSSKESADLPYFYSNSNEFTRIYNKERNSIESYSQDMFSSTNKGEYFAECFAWYLEKPDRLKDSSPLTYEFINRVYTLN